MMIFTVYGDAMTKGKKFYEDHVTFSANSWEEATEIAKEKYMEKDKKMSYDTNGNYRKSIIDDFKPISIIKGFDFEEDVEMRMI